MPEVRTYHDWKRDAKQATRSLTELGNELRNRWDDWKLSAPYETFDECIQTELGITAQALRDRNKRARKVATIAPATAATLQSAAPLRQRQSSPAEIERRREHVFSLWQEGHTARTIAEALGVSKKTVETDMAAKGAEGRRPRHGPEWEGAVLPWRNEDLDISNEESTTEQPSFAACETPSATEAIEDVRVQLSLLLGGRYHLSLKDRNSLITILDNALRRLQNGENQVAKDSSHSTRVAG